VTLEFIELDICKQYSLNPAQFRNPDYMPFEMRAMLIAKYQLEVDKQQKDKQELDSKSSDNNNGRGRRH
jgi:hypothetical protein